MPLLIRGEIVADSTLDAEVLRLSSGLESDAPEAGALHPETLRAIAVENVIARTLLVQEAKTRGLQVSDTEVKAELARRWQVERDAVRDPAWEERLHDYLLAERMRAELTRHVPRPARAEAERYYRSNLRRYALEEAVEAAHIFCACESNGDEVKARETLNKAEAALRKGKPFAQVADRYSDCKGVGGSVGWVMRGQMVTEFEEVVFGLKPGQNSTAFRTVFGWHVARVLRRRSAGVVPFADIKLEIARQLHQQARDAVVQSFVIQSKTESVIRYVEEPVHG